MTPSAASCPEGGGAAVRLTSRVRVAEAVVFVAVDAARVLDLVRLVLGVSDNLAAEGSLADQPVEGRRSARLWANWRVGWLCRPDCR